MLRMIKKKKNVSIAQMVETKNDSLVYALGQSASGNLNGYLKSEGILQSNPSDNKNITKMNDACMAEFKKRFATSNRFSDSNSKSLYIRGFGWTKLPQNDSSV